MALRFSDGSGTTHAIAPRPRLSRWSRGRAAGYARSQTRSKSYDAPSARSGVAACCTSGFCHVARRRTSGHRPKGANTALRDRHGRCRSSSSSSWRSGSTPTTPLVHDLTAPGYTALSVLARHPGVSLAELAVRSFVSPQSANQMIAALERRDLISRRADAANRRVLRTSLTEPGRRKLAACDAQATLPGRQATSLLSPAARSRLRADLTACAMALAGAQVEWSEGTAARRARRPSRPTW